MKEKRGQGENEMRLQDDSRSVVARLAVQAMLGMEREMLIIYGSADEGTPVQVIGVVALCRARSDENGRDVKWRGHEKGVT